MNDSPQWMPVPDFADALGVTATQIRDLLRTRELVAVRRGENDAWHIPAEFIGDDDDGTPRILPTLRGTFTLLVDAGFTDAEIIDWLFTFEEQLGTTPIAALREGRRAPVRRVAQALL